MPTATIQEHYALAWQDIPSWQTIVEDWHARMQSMDVPAFVLDLPVTGPDLRSFFGIEHSRSTWLPVDTLSKMKVATWDRQFTLLRGEPYAYRNPDTDFPYVSAGASDAAKILAANPDPTSFAAVMIAMSSLAVPRPNCGPAGAIYRVGQLAFGHIRTLGYDARTLCGRNRRSWLPKHFIQQDVETYDEAIAHLAGEHVAVLSAYRPVRFMPFIKGPKGFEPAELQDIEEARDQFEHDAYSRVDSAYARLFKPDIDRDYSARSPFFVRPGDEERYQIALEFFNKTLSAAGRQPARYARLPTRINLDTKAKGRRHIEVTLFRQADVCDDPSTETLISFSLGRDGSDPDGAAQQILDYVDRYEEALSRNQAIRAAGGDPEAIDLEQIMLSPLAKRAIRLAGIIPNKNLTFERLSYSDWEIFPRLDFDHPDRVEFRIHGNTLFIDEIDVPCPIHGCLTIRLPQPDEKHGTSGFILVPRPMAPLEADTPLHQALSTPALAGLPLISVASSDHYENRTVLVIDGNSPGLQHSETVASSIIPVD